MFISKTPLGVPSCTPSMRALHERYLGCLRSRSPDFMTPGPVEVVGYVSSLPPPNAPAYPPLPLKLVPSCRSMIIALRSSSFLLSLSCCFIQSWICYIQPEPPPGGANLNICSAAVAHAFEGCLAMTLEMPCA